MIQGMGLGTLTDGSRQSVLKVGLTGGIASGKSMIREILEKNGIATIDADDVVHELFRHDQALRQEIRQAFGNGVFTTSGEIDRQALGKIVFSDASRRKELENMIHPKVRQEIESFFKRHINDKLAVAVIPLLFESKLEQYYDVLWLVKASEDQQVDRLVSTRGLTREEALARIGAQMPFDEKLRRAASKPHAIIDNTGDKASTARQVQKLLLNA